MTLHISGHVEETAHEISCSHIVIDPLLIIEKYLHQSLRVGVFLLVFSLFLVTCATSLFLYNALPRLVQIELQRLADVVVNLCRWVRSSQLLTLGNHREDAARHGSAAGIDLQVLRLENLREVLSHTLADTVMLALANGCQVTQTFDGSGHKGLQFLQCLLA